MTEQEILKSIEIILYNAEYANKSGWRFYAAKARENFEGDSEYEYRNKTVELLLSLHQKLVTDKEKDFLLKSLEPRIGILIFLPNQPKAAQFVSAHQDFIFVFFIKINELDRALKMISNRIIITSTKTQLFCALSEILTFEPQTFDNIKLDEILSIVGNFQFFIKNLVDYRQDARYSFDGTKFTPAYDTKKIDDYKASEDGDYQIGLCKNLLASVKNRVYKIEHDRLSASLLEGINYEINQDQTQLQNIITEFGFDEKLNETLSKVNEKLYDAKDPFDFKNCIDLIRALLNELCISIALEIQSKNRFNQLSLLTIWVGLEITSETAGLTF